MFLTLTPINEKASKSSVSYIRTVKLLVKHGIILWSGLAATSQVRKVVIPSE